jgi:hypothetical protein
MSGIPPDLFARVHEFALDLTNASESGDDILYDFHYEALLAYFQEQPRRSRSHPFLTEALADYTEDPTAAVQLYRLALGEAKAFPEETTHTKLISLADRLAELGQLEPAQVCLLAGRPEPIRRGDEFWVEEADRLLKAHTG